MEYKKLDDKIKELQSTRVFKKVTPKFDLSWYVKWVASVFILLAVCFRASGGYHMLDLYTSFIGTLGWFWVGYLWHDRALILLNGALATLLYAATVGRTFQNVCLPCAGSTAPPPGAFL